jgi:cobalt-zinc-cadmium efflux system protein
MLSAMHKHPHDHHHEHAHDHQRPHAHGGPGAGLRAAAALTVAFALVEAAGGWWTGSLALLSDAGHMLTDGAALGLGALAAWMARRPPSERHSYGLGRAEVVAALINAAAMLVIVVALAYEAFVRLKAPTPVNGAAAAAIAAVGLALNLWVMRRLHGHDMNTRAARLHVIGDALGSVAALGAGAVIYATGWTLVDPLASLGICLLITLSSVRLLRESMHALMEGVPHGLSVETIGAEMARIDGVLSVHDLHVWQLSGSRIALSAHVVVRSMGHWERTLAELQARLQEKFGIEHITLQPESMTRPLVRH